VSITEEKRAYAEMRKPFSVLPFVHRSLRVDACVGSRLPAWFAGPVRSISGAVNTETSSIATAKRG
jgi:hypothetical protein